MEYQHKLDEINDKLIPLEVQKKELEAKILKYKELLLIENGGDFFGENAEVGEESTAMLIPKKSIAERAATLKDLTPLEAYKQIIVSNFSTETFKEADIRSIANTEGVRTREDGEISSSYSRSLFVHFKKINFVSQVERGIYRYQKQQSIT